ncbi:MAG TPA: serine/threonine-protein kinase [Kofleriaceae bacterium]|nr:serine/threonine-protein kinase [Kofleriaceae bacterium]
MVPPDEDPDPPWFTGTVKPIMGTTDHIQTSVERITASDGAPMTLEPDAGRFDDHGEIASGGTSSIREVFDRRIRRTVAMKTIDPSIATWPEAARLLIEEAQITGQLDHPNIVPVHDLGTDLDGAPMFIMKLVEGDTLTRLINEGDPKEPRPAGALQRLLKAFLRICDAVSFAHSRGVIHRDLKPDNVMIGSHGQIYVMDWGCAQLAPHGVDEGPPVQLGGSNRRVIDGTGAVIGTGAYMAPEQAMGRTNEIDARTDVFALGGVLYQILTRVPPYRGRSHLESVQLAQAAQITPPEEIAPQVPRALSRIVMKALDPEPTKRYASVDALRDAVEQFLDGGLFFESRVFPAGALVMREGDEADAAYIVTSGHCEAFRADADGKRTVLRRMGPGEVFGETAILTGGTRTASVIAIDELTTQVVTRQSIEDELRHGSWVGILVKALAERFRDVDARLHRTRDD